MLCCSALEMCIDEAGNRGLSVVVQKIQGEFMFEFQSRGISWEDARVPIKPVPEGPDVVINVLTTAGFKYCPWCGTALKNPSSQQSLLIEEKERAHRRFVDPVRTENRGQ